MSKVKASTGELARLAALGEYGIVGSPPDARFDAITSLAARVCEVPIAGISFLAEQELWFKSLKGMPPPPPGSRQQAFCHHTIAQRGALEVCDARCDRRFAHLDIVRGKEGIRFYAGFPVRAPGGHGLGALCVLDRVPRQLSRVQRCTLEELAMMVEGELESRRRARAALPAAEVLMDASADSYLLCDLKTRQILHANKAAHQVLDASAGSLHGLCLDELAAPGEAVHLVRAFAALLSGHVPADFSMQFNGAQGQCHTAAVSVRVVEGGKGPIGLIVARDMTSQLRIQSTLADEREFLRAVLENLADGVVACDADGVLSMFNRRSREWHGIDAIALPRERWGERYSLFEGDGRTPLTTERIPLARAYAGESVRGASMAILARGRPPRYLTADGDPILNAEGRKIGAVVVMHDVTFARHAEAALRASEQRYRDLVEHSPDMIFIHKNGMIRYINRVGIAMLGGRDAEDFVGKPALSFLHPDFHAVARARVRAMREPGDSARALEERMIRLDGQVIDVEIAASGIIDDGEFAIQVVGRDVTERRQTSEALLVAESRFRSIFENATEGIFQVDPEGRFIAVNPALARMHGYDTPAEFIAALTEGGRHTFVSAERFADYCHAIQQHGIVSKFEAEVHCRGGSRIWVSLNAHAVRNRSGNLLYYEGSAQDITDTKRYQRELEFHANFDSLTGLPNRNLLADRLQSAVANAQRYHRKFVVALIDLDNFKLVNDTLGHGAGDELLRVVARRMSACVRETDTVARVGGDEFVLVLTDFSNDEGASLLFHRLLDEIALPARAGSSDVEVTCSIGASVFPDDGDTAEALLKNADIALYRVKEQGRSDVQFFTASLNERMRERLMIETSLRGAAARQEFSLVFQPQVEAQRGGIIGLEALIRWNHPTLGSVPPGRFIHVAEETGSIVAIGEWVLGQALGHLAAWHRTIDPALCVSVNLSPRQFRHAALVPMIQDALARHGIPPHCLELEVTEGMMLHNVEEVIAILGRLKAMGLRIAMDDFGTGYSSLNWLKRLPLDTLKIDKTFIDDIGESRADDEIIRATLALAGTLDLRVVAEGVETAAQASFLRQHGAHVMQGYLFGRPLDAAGTCRYLAQARESRLALDS